MAAEKGLPAVPRGLPRELTFYLQSLQNVVARLGGIGRGTLHTRALRAVEAEELTAREDGAEKTGKGSIGAEHLAPGAVTEIALAVNCVTEAKIAPNSVGGDRLKPEGVDSAALKRNCVTADILAQGSVTREKLASGAVGREKIAPELFPVVESGEAQDGEEVNIGEWLDRPFVCLTGINVPVGNCGELAVGLHDLQEEGKEWHFRVQAVFLMDDERQYPGSVEWTAIGLRGK